MKYEIKGNELPVVICYLEDGETMITERGSMSWMSPNMKMETTSNGGIGKALGRMFAGEATFPEPVHRDRRQRHDRICFQLSGPDQTVGNRAGQ